MNALLLNLASKALQNKHTTGAAVAYALAQWGCPLLSTWWPSHKAQIDGSSEILKGAAVFYGFAAAGDGAKSAQAHEETLSELANIKTAIRTGDTSMITKSEVATDQTKKVS